MAWIRRDSAEKMAAGRRIGGPFFEKRRGFPKSVFGSSVDGFECKSEGFRAIS